MSGVDSKQRLLSIIEKRQTELVRFLRELVAIPSDNPPGDCWRIAQYVHHKFVDYQFKNVNQYDVPEQDTATVGMKRAANVVAYEHFSESEGVEITLNSHGDVVPPGRGWTRDPYGGELINGKLFGRGAAVSKSDIASFTFATLALREVAEELTGRISLAITFDEETGGEIGPKWLLNRKLIQPDIAICPGFTHSVVNAHNGCLHMEIKISGKQAHAAEPQYGHDALEAMTAVLQALYLYRGKLTEKKSRVPGIDSPTLVVGTIHGGINTNVVPDECIVRFDRRLIPEEDPELVERELETLIVNVVEKFQGAQVKLKRILLAKSFGPVPRNTPLVQAFKQNWSEVMGGELKIHGSPLYTDARHFYEAGIPVILFGAGPRTLLEANGHRADEHVNIDDLINATKIVATSLYDLLKK
ncbi:ArgE/DapE family deacylase [Bacillus sp. DNRA2]|uniref:ArgE/DapE family deacylase n=1 Tax=Bacillus sp. DNRA2 TaxID=2723053 RepID=UPI00145CF773|nr:ArgE/DapE family deacylase [Bacillus sp. DNRA2]NMD69906.1 ArgE/DapE family deacylase [Bacillus sp. DNRA2]